jgi:hypothetical protein
MSDITDAQLAQMARADLFASILAALIAKRVTASSSLAGAARASAAGIVADARLIMAEVDK